MHPYSNTKIDLRMMAFVILLQIFPAKSLNAQTLSSEKIRKILEKTDDLYRSQSSFSKILMIIKTPNWERELEMEAWSQGKERTLIRILSPKKERGVTTLKIENQMWNYFPKINQVIKIPSSMMMGSWMGSDFTNDDLVKEYRYSEDFLYEGKISQNQYIITLKPKKETVSIWGKVELKLDEKTEVPREELFFNDKGKPVRLMRFSKIEKHKNKLIPMVMTLENLAKKGHSTQVKYQHIELDLKIDEQVFSRQNLQKRI